MSDLATLKIVVDASGAIRVVDQFGNATEKAAKQATALETAAKRTGAVLGGALVAGLALAVKETADAQREQAQLAAALRSTAGASGQTLDTLNAQAAALRQLTAATGGEIAEAQALLLTFTKIGGEVFPRATATVLDMAQALGTDARGAALQLGKALNDPIQGVAALSRTGIQFSEGQKAVIAGLVETNRLAEAQKIILAELETQVGGSATAYRNTLGGALAALKESFLELFEVPDSEGMNALIEGINRLADGFGLVRNGIQTATAELDLFLASSNEAILKGLSYGSLGVLGNDGPGSGFDLETQINRRAAAEQRLRMLANERPGLVLRVNQGITARATARSGTLGTGAGTGGTGAAPPSADAYDLAVAQVIAQFERDAAAAIRFVADEQVNATTRAALYTGEFAEQIGEGATQVINFGDAIGQAGTGVVTLTEGARVFREQSQLALARFATGLLTDGLTSAREFWDGFLQLGRDAVGNIFAKAVMDKLGDDVANKLTAAFTGVGGGIFGALGLGALGSLFNIGALADAVAETNRLIADFARAPADAALSAEDRALQDATAQRDALIRRALGDRGLSDFFDGDPAQTRARLAARLDFLDGPNNNIPSAVATRLRDAIAQLDAIGDAYDANTAAIRANILALEEERRARQAATLDAFRDSLALSDASTLSPVAKLAEAQRQYDAILGLAQGGDASAIDSLPETARTLLDAARAVFASGARYADVFGRVTGDVDAVLAQLTAPPVPAPPPTTPPPPAPVTLDPEVTDTFEEIAGGFEELRVALVTEQAAHTAVMTELGQQQVGLLAQVVQRLDTLDFSVRQLGTSSYGGLGGLAS